MLDWSRAPVALTRPTRETRALASVIRDLAGTRDGANDFAERVWGISVRNDLSDDRPLVGRGVPDVNLVDEARPPPADGSGFLLDLDRRRPLAPVAQRFEDRNRYVGLDATDRFGLTALLVRSDGIVASVAEAVSDDQAASRAASRWFGDAVETQGADEAAAASL